jgi:phosphoribosylformylglycinamidine (FGAM) synthase-like amidotransferase family enzyme
MPIFSNGWLEGFKKQNHIKSQIQHSEVALVSASVEEEMVENRKVISQYKEEDTFNMDEFGLF